jgi:DNA polymerase-3 subunit delta'
MFASVTGHRRLTTLLSSAIARATLPPTLLFVGASGVGKFVVARAVAATLNCTSPVRDREGLPVDACGQCRSCERISRGVHVDVLTLEPDDRASIKIDVVRDVLDRTGYRPFEGRRRVVTIRDADALEDQAQNALLKSLEEPPPSTVFILTTAVPGVLLPTVRSRCMHLRFGRLTTDEVRQVLERDHGLGAEEAQETAALADGSVGHALALNSNDLAVLRDLALQLLRQSAASGAVASRLQAAATLVGASRNERSRAEVSLVLRIVSSMLRDIELLNTGVDVRSLAHPALVDDLRPLTRAFSGARARDAFAVVDRGIAALERNAGTKVVADWLATQI